MIKAYPPIWCENEDCQKCNLDECNKRSIDLLLPYRDTHTPANKKGPLEVTAIAVYLGFCPTLAQFFLQFPSIAPIAVVYSNFLNIRTRMPTSQPIHRILLDILANSDPTDLTDDVFRYRGLIFSSGQLTKKYFLETRTGRKTFKINNRDRKRITKDVSLIVQQFLDGSLNFFSTKVKQRCTICPIESSCHCS